MVNGGAQATCAMERCERIATQRCSYIDGRRRACPTLWCDEHILMVDGAPACRRHATALATMRRNVGTLHELPISAALEDRSLSLAVRLAEALNDPIVRILTSHLSRLPAGSQVIGDRTPRPLHEHDRLFPGWAIGWSVAGPAGRLLRVSLLCATGDKAHVVVLVDHLAVFTGDPLPIDAGSDSGGVAKITSAVGDALSKLELTWRRLA